MRELPEPSYKLFSNTDAFSRRDVLAIQRQAYEDGLRDAILDFMERAVLVENPTVRLAMKAHAAAMLTASQKPRCELCGYQHGHAIGCANNPVDIALKAASQKEAE